MGVIGAPVAHDSAALHVRGAAQYIDDMPELAGALHAAVGLSDRARADIVNLDLTEVAAAPGVVCALTAADLRHGNDIGPVMPGDPLLADGTVEYEGQALFAVAATTRKAARAAVKLARIEYADRPAILTIDDALKRKHFIIPENSFHCLRRGDAEAAIAAAPLRLRGEIRIGGQEHFYLESQVAVALPQEDGGMLIHSSTQNPTETQILAARILGLKMRDVCVRVRRMGGAFGGKETQAALPACIAAALAQRTGRAVKYRPSRADDFRMSGKRHPFLARYRVGVGEDGLIRGVDIFLAADCGMSADLSLAIVDRAMFHADNAYFYPAAAIVGVPCKTHKASNTAFRGFGGPQGMLLAEKILQDIAAARGEDSLKTRRRNLYREDRRQTPYGQTVDDDDLPTIVDRLVVAGDYDKRRRDVADYNRRETALKKGLALTPVKFGISFTKTFMNQAGALLVVYQDGTAQISHGGTEMGQGLFIKVAQVVASELGLPLSAIRCVATDTEKTPNTSPTAASSGADLNGMAAAAAAKTVADRLRRLLAEHRRCDVADVRLADGRAFVGEEDVMGFSELTRLAVLNRVSLSANGYYRTPKIHYDAAAGKGRPFYYYANGAAISEVIIDTFTGEYRLLRVDVLHDVGASLNPAIDLGQIEGGFAQGLGWLTSEELSWSDNGRLQTVGPATYKIPAIGDMPTDFRVSLYDRENAEETIYRSKAVGEPPLMLALSAWAALGDAAAAAAGKPVTLDVPVTPERLLMAIEQTKAQSADKPAIAGGG